MQPAPQSRRSLSRLALAVTACAVLLTSWSVSAPCQSKRDEKAVPKRATIDWPSAAADAQALSPNLALLATGKARARPVARAAKLFESYTAKEGTLALAQLNTLTKQLYAGVDSVPIPVLAPVDTARFLTARLAAGQDRGGFRGPFLSEAIAIMEFLPGLSGYDAILTVSAKLLHDLGIAVTPEPQLHIAGTFLIYGSDDEGERVADLQGPYPGLRRLLGTAEVTYTFRKYGVSYFVNADCSNAPSAAGSLSCTQADAIIRVVLRDLHLLGGGPVAVKSRAKATVIQPARISPDFKYYSPGNLLSGTSQQNKGGSASRVVYGDNLLFPIKDAPAYANSQVFMHGGDCGGQKEQLPRQPGDLYDRYRCKQNPTMVLFEYEGYQDNYSYPWRDNLCEARDEDGGPPECPVVKKGHAGQDIRPNKCVPGNGASCQIDLFEVVAVIAGKAWWKTGDYENDLRLMYDDPNNKFYYMYLHMSPKSLKDAGMERGKTVPVTAGRVIGKVGNYDKAVPDQTTAHLHFEIRRGDNIGEPLSPYLTLFRAYERLINAQGTEITD